jgi:hypothetical protein
MWSTEAVQRTTSDRRIPNARHVEDEAPPSRTRDTLPSPPPSGAQCDSERDVPASSDLSIVPGPLEDALDRSCDTIPTPPPESGMVGAEPVVIPPNKPFRDT